MNKTTSCVFDEYLADTAPEAGLYRITTYTSVEHTEILSSADQLALQAVAHLFFARGDVPITIAVEHSGNGRDWKPKNPKPEIYGLLAQGAGTMSLAGGEAWPVRPPQRFVRLRIEVGDGVHPFALHLCIHAVARTRTTTLKYEVTRATHKEPPPADTASVFGVQRSTLRELQRLVLSSAHLVGPARYEHVLRSMSGQSRLEVEGVVRRLGALDKPEKQLLIGMAHGFIAILSAPPEDEGSTS